MACYRGDMTPLDIQQVRMQYPALRVPEVVYLDNAAGAQVPEPVIDAVAHAMRTMQVNKGGAYAPSQRITELKESVRARTASFLNAPDPRQVAFGPNATTLVNLLAGAFGDALAPGDEVITTGLDHHSNVDPWRALTRRGVVVRVWEPRAPFMTLELDDLKPLLSNKTRLLTMTAASNALGTTTDVAPAAAMARAVGALAMVDLVHYAPHFLPDVQALGVDLAVFSPYKVFGPHLGVLYVSERARDIVKGPRLSFMDALDPVAWEPGTALHELIAGWGAALDYLATLGGGSTLPTREALQRAFTKIAAHERALCDRLLDGLDAVGAERYGLPSTQGRTATVAFNMPKLPAQEVARLLGGMGVAVAAGHYYAFSLMMNRLGLENRGGAVRASALHYTNSDDVDALLAALANLP